MDRIRSGLILAAALTALSATAAKADEWCGYAHHDDALIECGYATSASCESAVGKGGMCFVDPDIALNALKSRRVTPPLGSKISDRS
ncbi:MAG TPA: hypothetical protein VGH13_07975 [Xanthobacteraceae bacterium]|jgi:hypothetical protein